jgi:hypothetical protein
VDLVRTDVVEEHIYIFREERIHVLPTRPTGRHIPEGGILLSHRLENLKSYIALAGLVL